MVISKIKYVNIAVTNRCNLTCRQCSIWKEEPKVDISVQHIDAVLGSRILDEDVNVALTGGEPFLHKDLAAIVKCVLEKKTGCLRNISTNGTMKEGILEVFDKYGEMCSNCSLHVSLDGLFKHDAQRGQSLDVIRSNIKAIHHKFPNIVINLKFTVTPINYMDILPTYTYAKQQGLGFKIKLVENAESYTNKIPGGMVTKFSLQEKKKIINDLLVIYKDLKYTAQKDALLIRESIKFLLDQEREDGCATPFNRIFIMPDGEIFSCILQPSIGNINKSSLEKIWSSDKAEAIRLKIKQHGCCQCVAYHGFSVL